MFALNPGRAECNRLTNLTACAMEASELGERLLALCRSSENKFAEVHALLGSLAEDQRREVVRYKDEVID